MDPVSDVLRAVRLSGAYFYLVEAGAPWSIVTVAARELVPRILPEAEHLIAYHVLVSGSCWGGVDGEPQVRLRPGDVIVFPHGHAHFMSSDEGLGAGARRQTASSRRYPDTVYLGPSDGRDTTLVCGFLGCDVRPYNPLLASLPHRMHLPGIAGGWLAQFPRQVVAESRPGRAGSATMLTRMAELMLVEVVRRHVEALSPQQTGWLAGLRDDVVGAALARLHERPAHPWTLAELARAVASSRSVLSERFSHLVGVAPMLYLTRWRLQLAAERLAGGSAKIAAGRGAGRLRVGGGVQPRVQAGDRGVAGHVAARAPGRVAPRPAVSPHASRSPRADRVPDRAGGRALPELGGVLGDGRAGPP
jgi:AraC-like DNA-binding protein